MAGQMLGQHPTQCHIDNIFQVAQERGFTRCGEMFSVGNMCSLAREIFSCQTLIIQHPITRTKEIFQHLLQGLPVLIPYDADKNHEPCRRRGYSAHWALLTGFSLALNTGAPREGVIPDGHTKNLYSFSPNQGPELLDFYLARSRRLFVRTQQGKSRHSGLWDWTSLCDSNANLTTLNPKYSAENFILPVQGGFLSELKDYAVLLAPN